MTVGAVLVEKIGLRRSKKSDLSKPAFFNRGSNKAELVWGGVGNYCLQQLGNLLGQKEEKVQETGSFERTESWED